MIVVPLLTAQQPAHAHRSHGGRALHVMHSGLKIVNGALLAVRPKTGPLVCRVRWQRTLLKAACHFRDTASTTKLRMQPSQSPNRGHHVSAKRSSVEIVPARVLQRNLQSHGQLAQDRHYWL